MLDNFKVIYCPTLEGAMNYIRENGNPDFTVEGAYGNTLVKGSKATYDHHTEECRDNPAPCNADIEARDGGVILISHIDVDCMGGIMALAGEKPENPSLWETAERIDLTGASNLGDEPEMNQDEMRAFYCVLNPIQKELRELAAGEKDKGYVDVTKSIEKLNVDFKKIADRNNPEREPLLQAGRDRENQRIEKVESKCVYDDGATRGFISEPGVFCNGAYTAPGRDLPPAISCASWSNDGSSVVAFNSKINTLSDSPLRNPECKLNACNIMRSIYGVDFGENAQAGGHAGIAGSPRGVYVPQEYYDKTMSVVVPLTNIVRDNPDKDFKIYRSNEKEEPIRDITKDVQSKKCPVFEIREKDNKIQVNCWSPYNERMPEEAKAHNIMSFCGDRVESGGGHENFASVTYPEGTSFDQVCKDISKAIEYMPKLEHEPDHGKDREEHNAPPL